MRVINFTPSLMILLLSILLRCLSSWIPPKRRVMMVDGQAADPLRLGSPVGYVRFYWNHYSSCCGNESVNDCVHVGGSRPKPRRRLTLAQFRESASQGHIQQHVAVLDWWMLMMKSRWMITGVYLLMSMMEESRCVVVQCPKARHDVCEGGGCKSWIE